MIDPDKLERTGKKMQQIGCAMVILVTIPILIAFLFFL
jgi:hypothetical protein